VSTYFVGGRVIVGMNVIVGASEVHKKEYGSSQKEEYRPAE
jgi:hypothetical protein